MNFWHAVFVFLIAAFSDAVWARYTLAVGKHSALASAMWAIGIIATGVVSIDAYIDSRWYVLPVGAGAAIGTYLTVLHAKRTGTQNGAM